MSLAWSVPALVLAAVAPHPGVNVTKVERPPKPVDNASSKDCEMFAAVAWQKLGWGKAKSKWPLLVDVDEPKAIYRVSCPWAKWSVKAPPTAAPRDPIVVMFLRPQYSQGGNVASVWMEGQQDRNRPSGPEVSKQQYHVGKRNYGPGQTYWVVY